MMRERISEALGIPTDAVWIDSFNNVAVDFRFAAELATPAFRVSRAVSETVADLIGDVPSELRFVVPLGINAALHELAGDQFLCTAVPTSTTTLVMFVVERRPTSENEKDGFVSKLRELEARNHCKFEVRWITPRSHFSSRISVLRQIKELQPIPEQSLRYGEHSTGEEEAAAKLEVAATVDWLEQQCYVVRTGQRRELLTLTLRGLVSLAPNRGRQSADIARLLAMNRCGAIGSAGEQR